MKPYCLPLKWAITKVAQYQHANKLESSLQRVQKVSLALYALIKMFSAQCLYSRMSYLNPDVQRSKSRTRDLRIWVFRRHGYMYRGVTCTKVLLYLRFTWCASVKKVGLSRLFISMSKQENTYKKKRIFFTVPRLLVSRVIK